MGELNFMANKKINCGKIITVIRVISAAFIFIAGMLFISYENSKYGYLQTGGKVEQEIKDGVFITYVWKGDKVIRVWYISIDKLTDSLKIAKRLEGERILETLK